MNDGQESRPHISIIIPNLNSNLIDETIESLFAQTSFNRILEILVIGMDQPGLVNKVYPVRMITTGNPVTAPVARNIGIRVAKGNSFAFIDADCVAKPNWLEGLLSAQADGRPIVGGGISLEVRNYWQLCYNLTMFHEFLPTAPAGPRQNLGTLNLCVLRKVVDHVGLFDEHLPRGQDTEWTLRMRRFGYDLFFTPEAVVSHFPDVARLSQITGLWYRSGFYSSRVRLRYQGLIAKPPFHDCPVALTLASPVVGMAITARIFARNPRLLRYAHTAPIVFLTKIAWCLGASRQARGSEWA